MLDFPDPSSPNVTLLSQNSTNVLLHWSVPSRPFGPIDGYEFAYAEKGLTPSNWVPKGKDERSASVGKLEKNTDFTFHVRAYNTAYNSEKLFSPVAVLNASTKGF